MPKKRFSKKVRIRVIGINPYVVITAAEAERLRASWRRPMPVCVQVNGKPDKPWHINMMPVGNGDFYLYLHGSVRKAAGVTVGDDVQIEVWFDAAYRSGPQTLPAWFREALETNEPAAKNWQALPPSRQKEVIRYLTRLKSDEACIRNLHLALNALAGKPTHFLGRDWNDGK